MRKSLIIHPDELSRKWIDRISSLGCTSIGIHPVGGEKSYKSLENLINLFDDINFTKLLDYASDKGIEIEYEMHCARYLMPEKYFDSNPEYFRMNKSGERVMDYNFCVSDEDTMKIVEKNALKLAKKLYKSEKRFYFWLDDAKDSFCHCEKCKRFSPSDQQLMVLNRIIKKIKTEIPEAYISYLAYFDTIYAPEKVEKDDGIFLEYAPYERDFKKKAEEMKEDDKRNLDNLINFFGKKDFKVLEYWYDNSLFSKYTKPPKKLDVNNTLVKEDVKFYKSLGAEYMSSFACFLGDDYEEIYGEADLSEFKNI